MSYFVLEVNPNIVWACRWEGWWWWGEGGVSLSVDNWNPWIHYGSISFCNNEVVLYFFWRKKRRKCSFSVWEVLTLSFINIVFLSSSRDGDGIQDNLDNCPSIPNFPQIDTDKDGLGKKFYDLDDKLLVVWLVIGVHIFSLYKCNLTW